MLTDKKFWRSALIRAIRTMAQTALATIGSAALIEEVKWLTVLSATALAAVLSVLTSIITGLPEAEEVKEKAEEDAKTYEDYDEDGNPLGLHRGDR